MSCCLEVIKMQNIYKYMTKFYVYFFLKEFQFFNIPNLLLPPNINKDAIVEVGLSENYLSLQKHCEHSSLTVFFPSHNRFGGEEMVVNTERILKRKGTCSCQQKN